MSEKMLNTRIQQKHDIEVNWSKAVNFIPKIGEVIVYDPDENHAAARVKIGDGVKTVVELAFIDDAAKAALFKEIDMVDEKVEALGQLVGDASIPEQIEEALLKTQADWEVNDETSAAYVKNRTHYEEGYQYVYSGNIDDYETVEINLGGFYAKISDTYLTKEDLLGAKLSSTIFGDRVFDESLLNLEENGVIRFSHTTHFYSVPPNVMCEVSDYFGEKYYLTTGIWFFIGLELDPTITSLEKIVVHQLDPKFIPTASEEQLIQLLIDIDALPAMTDSNGAIFTHKDSILLI